jgi:hypothetical protein
VSDAPVSRSDLRRALVVNALAKPVNVLVPAAVLVACALVGVWWLALVALGCWIGLAANTFFDDREAQRVGERLREQRQRGQRVDPGTLSPIIARRVEAAESARGAIHAAIATSPFPLDEVGVEVDALVAAIGADAARAQRMHTFLLGEERPAALAGRIAQEPHEPVRVALEAKRDALARLKERHDALMAEMDRAILTLQTMHAQILDTGDRALEERRLVDQVSEVRERVGLVSAGLEEAYAETRVPRGA